MAQGSEGAAVVIQRDQNHYQRVVVALKETIQRMEDVDRIIPSWPIQ